MLTGGVVGADLRLCGGDAATKVPIPRIGLNMPCCEFLRSSEGAELSSRQAASSMAHDSSPAPGKGNRLHKGHGAKLYSGSGASVATVRHLPLPSGSEDLDSSRPSVLTHRSIDP